MIKPLKDGIRSIVKVDFQGNIHKTFRGTDRDKRHANEVLVLQTLEARNCPNVPRLLDYDNEGLWILTTNCGRPVEATITRKKNDQLYKELEENYGIKHDDPEPRNITYSQKLGCFCIIDFELAEILDSPQEELTNAETLNLNWFGYSDKGQKENNEDSWRALCSSQSIIRRSTLGESWNLCQAPFIAGIADGMGGGGNGDLASKYLMDSLQWELSKIDSKYLEAPSKDLLTRICNDLNSKLKGAQAANDELRGMGATLALAFLFKNQLISANIGDSRVYLFRNETLTQLSEDHSFAWKQLKKGEINEIAYRQHPRRSILFSSINGSQNHVYPSLSTIILEPADLILICSDGLIDGLWEKHIRQTLLDHMTSDNSVEDTTMQLIAKAREADPRDDCSVILLEVEK